MWEFSELLGIAYDLTGMWNMQVYTFDKTHQTALKIYEDFTVRTLFLNIKNMKTYIYITICINQTKMCSAVRQYPES